MLKPVLENGNVNGFGTNAQTVFHKRRNPKRVFMVVEFGKNLHFDLLRGNGFRQIGAVYRISSFWPVKFKRCASPPRSTQQESHITRAVVTSVYERISNRRSPVSFLWDGDPDTFDDEVCGLFRFGGAVMFDFDWLVLLLMFDSLFAGLTLKTFSAPSNKTLWVLSKPGLVHLRALGQFRNMWSGCKQAKHNLFRAENWARWVGVFYLNTEQIQCLPLHWRHGAKNGFSTFEAAAKTFVDGLWKPVFGVSSGRYLLWLTRISSCASDL